MQDTINTEKIGKTIDTLKSASHQIKAIALNDLINQGYFGSYFRMTNGGLLWHLIHRSGSLNDGCGNPYSVDVVLEKMKSCVKTKNFSEKNLKYIQELVDIKHWGDLTRIELKDNMSLYMKTKGMGPKYKSLSHMKIY